MKTGPVDRRTFMSASALLAVGTVAASRTFIAPDPKKWGVIDGLSALSSKVISAREYCSASLQQAQTFSAYNIFTQIGPDYALRSADKVDALRQNGLPVGALAGIPYAVKDSVDIVEYYTISGHPSLRSFRPKLDADLVTAYKRANAICIGKTQLPPLSLGYTTENPLTGDTGNPHNRGYKTGGSSGGSAAAVAARITPFAVAEDTGGSIRVPAAVNGVQGFRPTTGRWPTEGTMPAGFSDTLGPIARSVADIKFLDRISANDHGRFDSGTVPIRGLRFGYQAKGFLEKLHPWVEDNFEVTLTALSNAGAKIMPVKGLPFEEASELALKLILADFGGNVSRYFKRHGVYDYTLSRLIEELDSEPLRKNFLRALDSVVTGESYFDLVNRLMILRMEYSDIINTKAIDVLVYPTIKSPNTPNDGPEKYVFRDHLGIEISESDFGANMRFAPAMRSPSIALFSGLDPNGLPLSVTLDGLPLNDGRLLQIAQATEAALPPLVAPKLVGQDRLRQSVW